MGYYNMEHVNQVLITMNSYLLTAVYIMDS